MKTEHYKPDFAVLDGIRGIANKKKGEHNNNRAFYK